MVNHPKPSYRRSRTVASALIVVLLALVLVIPALASGGWTATGNLVAGRAEHSAVRLNDGRVLLVGGRVLTPAASSAEIYDPATGTWSATGPKNFVSVDSAVTLLADGRVLAAGSHDDYFGSSNLAEIYDPATDTWTQTGSMTRARTGILAVRLNDGRVLVTSNEWPGPTAELYDPTAGTWSATGSPNTWHGDGTTSLLPDGRVLLAGGTDNWLSGSPVELVTTTAEIYDPTTGVWQITGSLNTARKFHTATQLADGRVLVAAGHTANNKWLASAEIYNPATGIWSPAGSLNHARYLHTSTLLANGQVLVAGMPDVPGVNLLSAELYDPGTGAWSDTTDMPEVRWSHSATLLTNGEVLLAGGLHNDPTGFDLRSAVLFMPGDSTPPPPPPANNTHVGDLDGSSFSVNQRYWGATVTISVLDKDGMPVANATVSGNWSGGISGNAACTTGASGACSVTSANVRKNKSSVNFAVSNVSHATLTYDAAANQDPDGDSTGSSITVSKP